MLTDNFGYERTNGQNWSKLVRTSEILLNWQSQGRNFSIIEILTSYYSKFPKIKMSERLKFTFNHQYRFISLWCHTFWWFDRVSKGNFSLSLKWPTSNFTGDCFENFNQLLVDTIGEIAEMEWKWQSRPEKDTTVKSKDWRNNSYGSRWTIFLYQFIKVGGHFRSNICHFRILLCSQRRLKTNLRRVRNV